MTYIDDVIAMLHTLQDPQRATWRKNAERVIARGPRRNAAHADALRLRDAITTFEATRPAEDKLITAAGLDWDRVAAGRTIFRGFDGTLLVARIIRVKPAVFTIQVQGETLANTFATLVTARAVAAETYNEIVRNASPVARAA